MTKKQFNIPTLDIVRIRKANIIATTACQAQYCKDESLDEDEDFESKSSFKTISFGENE